MTIYLGLFLSALLSATLLPGSSEVLLLGLLQQGHDSLLLWGWATAGNTLGSVVNWWLGRYLLHFQHRRWFPFKPETLARSQQWFQKYGVWSLLLAWAPVIGDGITFVAGVMKVRAGIFLLLVFVSKATRYALLLGLFEIFSAYF